MAQRKAKGTSGSRRNTSQQQQQQEQVLVNMPADSTATVLLPKEQKQQSTITENPKIKIEIAKIKADIEQLRFDLVNIEQQEVMTYKNKSAIIRELATKINRLRELGDIKEQENEVCNLVCKELRKSGLWRSERLAHKVLEDRFKHIEFNPHKNDHLKQQVPSFEFELQYNPLEEEQAAQSPMPTYEQAIQGFDGGQETEEDEDDIVPEEQREKLRQQKPVTDTHENYQYPLLKKETLLAELPQPRKPPHKLTREEKREITENILRLEGKVRDAQKEIRRRRREYVKLCQQEKIALSPELDKNRQTHITAVSKVSGISEASDAIDEHIEMWEKVKETLIKYKPPEHIAEKIAYYLRAENEFLKPWADQKYRLDEISWHIAELENVWQGKHASAKKMKVILEQARKDEDGIIYDEEIARYLTREQVGDNFEKIIRQALILTRAFKYKLAIHKWYVNQPQKAIAQRAHELRPILSEKAFSGT